MYGKRYPIILGPAALTYFASKKIFTNIITVYVGGYCSVLLLISKRNHLFTKHVIEIQIETYHES